VRRVFVGIDVAEAGPDRLAALGPSLVALVDPRQGLPRTRSGVALVARKLLLMPNAMARTERAWKAA
jgi:hypothetical protein